MGEYRGEHREMVQLLLHKRVVRLEELASFASQTLTLSQPIDRLIQDINTTLGGVNKKMMVKPCDLTGKDQCFIVSTVHDSVSLGQGPLTEAELEYLHRVRESILESRHGLTPSLELINLGSGLEKTPINPLAAEEALKKFLLLKLLMVPKPGFYSCSVFSVHELTKAFQMHPDSNDHSCVVCNITTVLCNRCNSCQRKVHISCYERYRGTRSSVSCPNCRANWSSQDSLSAPFSNSS